MSDLAQPQSALDLLLKPGRYPRVVDGAINLVVQEQRDVAQIQMITRNGRNASLVRRVTSFLGVEKALAPQEGGEADGIHIYATGPREHWVFSAKYSAQQLERRLAEELGDAASLFDQSHGRFILLVSGDSAAHLLAKGTSLDLNESAFLASGASHSTIEHIPALVLRCETPKGFQLSVPRSYAGSLMAWLCEAAQEFGYILK